MQIITPAEVRRLQNEAVHLLSAQNFIELYDIHRNEKNTGCMRQFAQICIILRTNYVRKMLFCAQIMCAEINISGEAVDLRNEGRP